MASPDDLLTADERAAVQMAGHLYTFIAQRIMTDGPNMDGDLAELRGATHLIQRAVLANAAARAFPTEIRKLGGELT
jgi:hypothetical protein